MPTSSCAAYRVFVLSSITMPSTCGPSPGSPHTVHFLPSGRVKVLGRSRVDTFLVSYPGPLTTWRRAMLVSLRRLVTTTSLPST